MDKEKIKKNLPPDQQIKKMVRASRIINDFSRLKILAILSSGELNVNQISSLMEISPSAVSHQLNLLRSSNLVKFRKKGKESYYSLNFDREIVNTARKLLDNF